MRRGSRDLLARLVLAVCLLAGVSPAQGLVLCFEADGSAAIEAASASSGCEGCPGAGDERTVVVAGDAGSGCQACVDIPLPKGREEPGARLKSGEPKPACMLLLPALSAALASCATPQRGQLAPPAAAPRQAPGLALIRTVILRV